MQKKLAMVRFIALLALIVLFIVITACGADDTQQETEQKPADMQQDKNNGETTSVSEAPYSFIEFDLEADFENIKDAVEVEYEFVPDRVEASYNDKNQGIRLSNDEALHELDDHFAQFDFDENSSKEEVLAAVRKAFNIPEDALLDLDITFATGTEKEY